MSAVVAVAIRLAAELSPELAARTMKSCQAALGVERCYVAGDAPPADDFYATVTSEEGDAVAHIRLLRHGTDASAVAERDLAFEPEDALADRWASVGVVIAALVTAAAGMPPPPPVAPPRPRATRPHVEPTPPPPTPKHAFRIDLLARSSRETSTNYPAELGAVVRGSFAPARGPLFLRLTAGYAGRLARQPDLTIPSVRLGGGFRWGAPEARFGAELYLDALAVRWILSASEPGRTDSQGVWRAGGVLGIDGTWGVTRPFQVVAGLDVQALTPRVSVDVRGENTELVPLVGAGLNLGVRFVP